MEFFNSGALQIGSLGSFLSGTIISLVVVFIAWLLSRNARLWALKQSEEAERADRNAASKQSGRDVNPNAGRGWNTIAQALPYAIWIAAMSVIVTVFPVDLAFLSGAFAGGSFGFFIAAQDILTGLAAKQIIIFEDAYRDGDELNVNDNIVVVEKTGPYFTRVHDYALDAVRLIPNAQMINSNIINYDGKIGAKFVQHLYVDDSRLNAYSQGGIDSFDTDEHGNITNVALVENENKTDHIGLVEYVVTDAIKKWSIGDDHISSCELVEIASDSYVFRLVGYTDKPSKHPVATVNLYHTAVNAVHAAGYSVGRTNNNTHSINPDTLSVITP